MRGSEIDKGEVFSETWISVAQDVTAGGAPQPWRHDPFPDPGLLLHLGKPGRGLLDVGGAGAGA